MLSRPVAMGRRPLALVLGAARTSAVVLLIHALPAVADDRMQLEDRVLAAGCSSCHGQDGRPPKGSPFPPLAGMEAARLRDAMQGYRHGSRDGTVMPQLAKGFSDAQIDRLAAFFAAQAAVSRQP